MSDAPDATATLEALRERRRSLELDAVAVKARCEEVAELIAMLEHSARRRPGRPRKPVEVIGLPIHQPEPEDAA
jgi:hypothetical protein